MLRAVGRDGERTLELALNLERSTLWFRTAEDLWDMKQCKTADEAYAAAERFGVARTDWADGPEFTLTDAIQAHAMDAVAMARDQFKVALDLSEGSVKLVEEILGKIYDQRPRGLRKLMMGQQYNERLAGFANAFGAYMGEVFRRHYGGTWAYEEKLFPGQKVLALKWDDNSMIFPPAKVHKRLTNGAEDNVAFYYQVFAQKRRERAGDPVPPTV